MRFRLEGLNSIVGNAIWGCTELTQFALLEGATSLGGCAFFSYIGLARINVPEGPQWVDGVADTDCPQRIRAKFVIFNKRRGV